MSRISQQNMQLDNVKIKVRLLHIFKYYINDATAGELDLLNECFNILKLKYPAYLFNIQLILKYIRSTNNPNVRINKLSEYITQFYNRELYIEIINILDF